MQNEFMILDQMVSITINTRDPITWGHFYSRTHNWLKPRVNYENLARLRCIQIDVKSEKLYTLISYIRSYCKYRDNYVNKVIFLTDLDAKQSD